MPFDGKILALKCFFYFVLLRLKLTLKFYMQIQLKIEFKISIPHERKKGSHHLSALLPGVLGTLNAEDVTQAAAFFRALNLLC